MIGRSLRRRGLVSMASSVLALTATLTSCELLVDVDGLAGGASPADAGQDSPTSPVALEDAAAEASGDAGDGAPPPALLAGLVGQWRLDESAGSIAADSSSQPNPGTLHGGPKWSPSSHALSFDGLGQYVEIAGTTRYVTRGAPFSFSAWFELVDFSTSDAPDIMQLRTDSADPIHVLLSNRAEYLGISVGSASTWSPMKTGQVPTLAVWHHVAVTYNGKGPDVLANFQVSLDGAPQSLSPAAAYGSQPQGSRIGSSTGGNQWKGLIRDVRIYDRVLGADEIRALHDGMLP